MFSRAVWRISLGIFLVLACIGAAGWYLYTNNWLIVSNLDCQLDDAPCSDELQTSLESQLFGQQLFTANLDTISLSNTLTITQVIKILPSTISVQLHQRPLTLAEKNGLLSTTETEAAISALKALLDEEKIAYNDITSSTSGTALIVWFENDLRALVTTGDTKQYAKLVIIRKQLDIDSVDTAIKEIDVRFKLPVLRTTVSTVD